jgi:hypothetical protein
MTLYDTRNFTVDSATTQLAMPVGGPEPFDWSEVEVVQIDNAPFERAFDTDTFYKIPTTVARPIQQDYTYGDTEVTLKKPAEELKKATYSLDNAPLTLQHTNGPVQSNDDVRGFMRDAYYAQDDERLVASVYLPVDDEPLVDAVESGMTDVSVGFYNETKVAEDGGSVDGYQTDIYFNHVALVDEGRCSREDGCGLALDAADAVTATRSKVDDTLEVTVNTRVKWQYDDVTEDDAEDFYFGEVRDIVHDGCVTPPGSDGGEVCAQDGDPATVVEVYDTEAGEFSGEYDVHLASELQPWEQPTSDVASDDGCSDGACSCGNHTEDSDNSDTTNMTDDGNIIDVDDLTVDALAEKHEGVEELQEDRAELKDEVSELEDQLDATKETLDSVKEDLASYREDEKGAVIDEIVDLTDTWDEDELAEKDIETLQDRLELAKDISSDVSTPEGEAGSSGDDEVTEDSTGGESEYKMGETYSMPAK